VLAGHCSRSTAGGLIQEGVVLAKKQIPQTLPGNTALLIIGHHVVQVSPSWVTSSRAAGSWLPEQGFEAAPRWSGTAALVRQRQAQQPPAPPPLCDRLVYVHCNADKPATAAKSADLRQGLQRLVMALGGKVSGVSFADIVLSLHLTWRVQVISHYLCR
jgi:hypothetical protein